jgi:Carboxypeptidase regulatory-like domain/Prealbumin-like fold domain
MGRSAASLAMVCLLPLIAVRASACSTVGCVGGGVEMRGDFTVKIRHADKPLLGATVEISGPQGASSWKKFTVTTDEDGIARVSNLVPGDYWLDAEYLEIGAAYHCFHVKERPSQNAKRKLTYEWGDFAPGTRHIAGRLLDSQPGKGGTPIWNILHRVDVPIVAANLTLANVTTKAVYHAKSNAEGAFSFDGVPSGTYVLHIDAGTIEADRVYDASDHLIRLDSTGKRDSLLLKRREAGGGSCGGTSLELQDPDHNS